jgi:pyruvate dehydrogenase E2 component (dihydrolipoamide acetyltransferase)
MPIKIEMPRLSDTMQAGTVVKWNVKEGQKVKAGDVIADIETDKATMELPTYEDGTIASIVVPEGKNVPIGTVIVIMAAVGEDVAAAKAGAGSASAPAAAQAAAPAAAQAAGSSTPVATTAPAATAVIEAAPASHGNGRVFVSPLARKIADESGVDLSRVQGTGPSGRIVRRDVEEALRTGATAPAKAASAGAAAVARPAAPLPSIGSTLKGEVHQLSNMRRVIAKRLVESKTTIPHYQVTVEVDVEALSSLRVQLNEQLASQGVKLSVNDFLVRACALAMHQHPFVNSRWVNSGGQEAIETLAGVNVGVAIALDQSKGGGLVVATLRNADQIGLRQISAQTKQLADKARAKGLSPEEMSDSTFTISNLGMFGVAHFTAIINPPNACILAVGAALDRPVVKNGQIVPGKIMSMTMSSDHRIVDGAMAAAYLATVKDLLEKPASLLV